MDKYVPPVWIMKLVNLSFFGLADHLSFHEVNMK